MGDLVGDEKRFIAEYLHARPLIGNQTTLDLLPSRDALWNTILTSGARQPAFRVVRAGETTGRSGVTRAVGIGNRRPNDVVDPNAVVERYRDGDTIVLQALHQSNADLARLVTNLSLALDQPTQVNAYLSPPDEQGLDIHFDYHDVIVIQISGTKSWRLWDPLDRTTDPVRSSTKVAPLEADELGEPLHTLTLGPGDVLYLPRGYPHVASTTTEPSEHLTIGITAIGWSRYLESALEAAVRDGSYRRALPARSLDRCDPPSPPSFTPIAAAIETGNYRHWMAQQIWRRMPQTRLRPLALPAETPEELVFTPGPLLWLTAENDKAIIGLGDRLLQLPIEAHEFLEALFAGDKPIRGDDFDQLDAKSRTVVLNRLVAVGALAPPTMSS